MKILFIGSVLFSKAALEKLILLKADIAGVVCKKESGFNSDFFDLGITAMNNNIKCLYTEDINSFDSANWIRNINPDIIFCFGWSQLLKKEILTIPGKGVVGFHPAKLPSNRGRHPLIWALFLGLTHTASTFFFMDEHADTGRILSQENIPISDDDDAASLYSKTINTALTQIENFLPKLTDNTYTTEEQKTGSGNVWRKRGAADGKIDWRMSSKAIYNLVRALTKPYIGAHCLIKNLEYKVWKVEIVDGIYEEISNIEPGKVLKTDFERNTIDVKTYDGAIKVLQHEITDLKTLGEHLK